MKKQKTNTNQDDSFNDEESYYKSKSRSFRSREKALARRKVDAYMDKKSLMKNFDELDLNKIDYDDDEIWSQYEQSFYDDVDSSMNYEKFKTK
jgi:hypothetical protein